LPIATDHITTSTVTSAPLKEIKERDISDAQLVGYVLDKSTCTVHYASRKTYVKLTYFPKIHPFDA
jgi:hypothetical protein